jgi:hypothetical protein
MFNFPWLTTKQKIERVSVCVPKIKDAAICQRPFDFSKTAKLVCRRVKNPAERGDILIQTNKSKTLKQVILNDH